MFAVLVVEVGECIPPATEPMNRHLTLPFSLGPGQHTQYSLKALPQFTYTIVSVALGQDHTLALTTSGEVLSWGLNRFSQLGYVVESTVASEGFGRVEELMQATPRKVHGALRKEVAKGIAASKGASACWTTADVYTWGTNNGQLGMCFVSFFFVVSVMYSHLNRL